METHEYSWKKQQHESRILSLSKFLNSRIVRQFYNWTKISDFIVKKRSIKDAVLK